MTVVVSSLPVRLTAVWLLQQLVLKVSCSKDLLHCATLVDLTPVTAAVSVRAEPDGARTLSKQKCHPLRLTKPRPTPPHPSTPRPTPPRLTTLPAPSHFTGQE